MKQWTIIQTSRERRDARPARSIRDSGRPLEPEVRAQFEPVFRHDFGAVRVHADAEADRATADVGALAAAVGDDLYFRSARYEPDRARGQRLLAHELAHVVQTRRGGVPAPGLLSDHHDAAEGEARAAADHAMAGEAVSISAAPSGAVMREDEEYHFEQPEDELQPPGLVGTEQLLEGQSGEGASGDGVPSEAPPEAHEEQHHHKAGLLDRMFGLNPDHTFVEAGMDALGYGRTGIWGRPPAPGEGNGTTLLRGLGAAAMVPIVGPMVVGGHALDELNHGPSILHGAFDK